MNKYLRAFCWLVLQLDRIPRYGRLYSCDIVEVDGDLKMVNKTVKWRYQKFGRWGWDLLSRMKLLWPYLKYHNPDI
jgi:hypothetical protein